MIPFGAPVPPSPDTSEALVAAFAERDIEFVPSRRVASLDGGRSVAVLDDGTEMPFDLFLGVPRHRAPDVVIASGMTEDGYVPVARGRWRRGSLVSTRSATWQRSGCRRRASSPRCGACGRRRLIAAVRGDEGPDGYGGRGSATSSSEPGRVGRVDVDFLSGPKPTGTFREPSGALVTEKKEFGSSRSARWFGR